MTEMLDRIRTSLERMPRALEALDHTLRRLERGELSALEAIDGLLAEEHANREGRRIAVALKTARLNPPKTLYQQQGVEEIARSDAGAPQPWRNHRVHRSDHRSLKGEPTKVDLPGDRRSRCRHTVPKLIVSNWVERSVR